MQERGDEEEEEKVEEVEEEEGKRPPPSLPFFFLSLLCSTFPHLQREREGWGRPSSSWSAVAVQLGRRGGKKREEKLLRSSTTSLPRSPLPPPGTFLFYTYRTVYGTVYARARYSRGGGEDGW